MKLFIKALIIAVASVCLLHPVRAAHNGPDSVSGWVYHFERKYILVVPEGDKIAFYCEENMNRAGVGVNEEFMPFGRAREGETTATVRKIHNNSVDLYIKNYTFFKGVESTEEEVITIPFSPAWIVAIYKGDVGALRALLDKGLDVNSRDGFGRTPLMIAGFYGQREMVGMLLDKGVMGSPI